MAKPRILLDTNICADVVSGAISDRDWRIAKERIRRQYKHVVSTVTLIELFTAIENGDDAHFQTNRSRIKVVMMDTSDDPEVLRLPGSFVVRHLFGGSDDGQWPPGKVRSAARVVLRAKDRAGIRTGVEIPGQELLRVIDLTGIARNLERGKNEHVARLERIRAGRDTAPDGRTWARHMVELAGGAIQASDLDRAAEACDAAYRFDVDLFQVVQAQYNIEDRDSDWMDIQQLLYLCDPRVRILTKDTRMIRRVQGSAQAAHVLPFSNFISG